MRVPDYQRTGRKRQWTRRITTLLALAALSAHALPRSPQPVLKLKLTALGFPGVPQALQEAGASMLTVHFVDGTHLLVTYSLRGLVERIPGDPIDDDDRAVAALLVEIPSGNVLARTRWHLHDHGQYLWSLGNGRFLVRMRSTLIAVAPLANLATPDPFRQMPFVETHGNIDAVLISPEGDLVTVETSPPRKPVEPRTGLNIHDPYVTPQPPPETFHFIRVSGSGAPEAPVRADPSGAVRARGVGLLPVNGRGYLFAKSGKRNRWEMQFDSFDGATQKLTYVDSSCAPRMQFVSPSQYLVFSCRGSNEKIMISAFNFLAHETWEELLSGSSPFANFAYSPAAGRFAISRTVSTLTTTTDGAAMPTLGTVGGGGDPTTTQDVRVYQMESGDLLLKLPCTPVMRTGQNFDLASDGLSLLAVRDGVIEIYTLPSLSPRDKKELAEVQMHEPPLPRSSEVKLRALLDQAGETTVEAEAGLGGTERPEPATPPAPAALAAATATTPAAPPPANAPANAGDVQDAHRKAPSLLNPGEPAENAKKPQP